MTRRMLAALLALMLCAAMLLGAAAEDIAAEPEAVEEIFTAPVDETVEETEDVDLWTKEIEADVKAAEEAAEAAADAEAARLERMGGAMPIDADNFPDATFRSYLENEVDADGDGVLSKEEIAGVTEINLAGGYAGNLVADLKGVAVFHNLKTLNVKDNAVETVDLSGLKRLENLEAKSDYTRIVDVSGTSISEWDYTPEDYPNLKSLDVSNCTELTRVGYRSGALESLNIKGCPAITYLSVYDNNLTAIDFTGCTMLKLGIDYGGYIDGDGDVDFRDEEDGVYIYFDAGVYLQYNGGTYPYLVDGEYFPSVEVTSVKFTKKSLKLKYGKSIGLKKYLKVNPADAIGSLTWTTSKKSVATVDANGVVTSVKPGTTKITATAPNGKKATISVTVKAVKPTKVTIKADKKKIEVGEKITLTAKLSPSNAYSTITWKSSNTKVATVSKKGVVKGKKAGKVKITATCTANKKIKKTITITVKKKAANPVKYRALLVGQVNYTSASRLPGCAGDVDLMYNMLSHSHGAEGGAWEITRKQDLGYDAFFSAIDSAFAGADANDVSLLFYSGHGASDGSLCAVPYATLMNQSTIASKLQGVPGKVIIMYDACHSGSGVYTYGEENSAGGSVDAMFDAAVVKAFAAADDGILVDAKGNGVVDGEAKTGELRVANKFYVLTAARKSEYSWCNASYSYFTKWATDGVGTSGKLPADANGDGIATLNEMFNYISDVGDDQTFNGDHQHVQVYPRNSSFKMFKR